MRPLSLPGRTWLASFFSGALADVMPPAVFKRARLAMQDGFGMDMDTGPGFLSATFHEDSLDGVVNIAFELFSPDNVRKFLKGLESHSRLPAQLLSGNAPWALAAVCRHSGCLPDGRIIRPPSIDCSLCGKGTWCVHAAAACLFVAVETDRDAMVLLDMAGITRTMIVGSTISDGKRAEIPAPPARPLSAELKLFWGTPDGVFRQDPATAGEVNFLRRLGPLPFEESAGNLPDFLGDIYDRAQKRQRTGSKPDEF